MVEDKGRTVAAVKRAGDGRAREMVESVERERATGEGESEVGGVAGRKWERGSWRRGLSPLSLPGAAGERVRRRPRARSGAPEEQGRVGPGSGELGRLLGRPGWSGGQGAQGEGGGFLFHFYLT